MTLINTGAHHIWAKWNTPRKMSSHFAEQNKVHTHCFICYLQLRYWNTSFGSDHFPVLISFLRHLLPPMELHEGLLALLFLLSTVLWRNHLKCSRNTKHIVSSSFPNYVILSETILRIKSTNCNNILLSSVFPSHLSISHVFPSHLSITLSKHYSRFFYVCSLDRHPKCYLMLITFLWHTSLFDKNPLQFIVWWLW